MLIDLKLFCNCLFLYFYCLKSSIFIYYENKNSENMLKTFQVIHKP